MRTLAVGVFAEGPTDLDFYAPLLARVSENVIREAGRHPVRIADVTALPGRPSQESFARTIREYAPTCGLIVVHTDGAGDPNRARRERIEPWFRSVDQGAVPVRLVELIPVRETEAWMLCDLDALNRVLGTARTRSQFGVPNRTREVEQVQAPKELLREIQVSVVGARRARKLKLRPLYPRLGQEVSLDELGNVPAFCDFLRAFKDVLASLAFIPLDPRKIAVEP